MAHHRLLPFLALIISLLILPSSSLPLQTTPALFSESGDDLQGGGNLTHEHQTLALHNNCSLIYYKDGTEIKSFNTTTDTKQCVLNVNNYGQLVLLTGDPDISPQYLGSPGKKGDYALLFTDDGLGVFGPAVWSNGVNRSHTLKHKQLKTTTTNNFLRSLDYVNGNAGNNVPIATNKDVCAYISPQCTLTVMGKTETIWESNPPSDETKECFLWLGDRGQLLLHYLENSQLQTQWSGGYFEKDNPSKFYVAVLRSFGRIAVFGLYHNIIDIPDHNPTKAAAAAAVAENIKMVTA